MSDSTLVTPPPTTGTTTTNGHAPRQVRRRQSLPTARAVVGGLLVAVSALGLYLAWASASAPPTTRYVVAARDLAIGAPIGAGDLTTVAADLPSGVAAFPGDHRDALTGAIVLGPVAKGELLQASDVLRSRAGIDGGAALEVSIPIERSRAVGGALRPGERVVADHLGREATDAEVDPYWRELVAANRARLADPDNPDLIFPGDVLRLPTA